MRCGRSKRRAWPIVVCLCLQPAVAGATDPATGRVLLERRPAPPPEPASSEYERPGVYGGLGPSYLFQHFDGSVSGAGFGDSWGFYSRLGYRLDEFFAIEGLFEYGDLFSSPQSPLDLSTESFHVAGKVHLPIDRLHPYLYGGVGFLNVDATIGKGSETIDVASGIGFAGRVGGGFDLWLNDRFSLTADFSYVMPTGEVGDYYYTSVTWGLRYSFPETR